MTLRKAWRNMLDRTTEGAHRAYEGVGHDPRWDEFEAFAADMAEGYFEGAVLARTGDQGHYEQGNVRWTTKRENALEQAERTKLRLSDGRGAVDVARENGVSERTFHSRRQAGWDITRAATTPTDTRYRK